MLAEELKIYRNYQKNISWKANHENPVHVPLQTLLNRYQNFLLDGFGTLYLRDELFDDTLSFIDCLRAQNKTIRLVTNTASRSPKQLAKDLQEKGILFEPHEIISSGSLLSELVPYLPSKNVFHFGKDQALEILDASGLNVSTNNSVSTVILSSFFDTQAENEEFIAKAKEVLRRPNSILVVMNPDICAPLKSGNKIFVSGYYANLLAKNTPCQSLYLGKPFPLIYQKAMQSLYPSKGATLMLGDTLGTDVMGANTAGISSALLLRGNTLEEEMREDFYQMSIRPHYLLKNLNIE